MIQLRCASYKTITKRAVRAAQRTRRALENPQLTIAPHSLSAPPNGPNALTSLPKHVFRAVVKHKEEGVEGKKGVGLCVAR
jgi:hypothetical protein